MRYSRIIKHSLIKHPLTNRKVFKYGTHNVLLCVENLLNTLFLGSKLIGGEQVRDEM